VGDFNGNGRTDILVAPRYDQCQLPYHSKFAAYFDGSVDAGQVTWLSPTEACEDAHDVYNPIDPLGAMNWFSLGGVFETVGRLGAEIFGAASANSGGAHVSSGTSDGTLSRMSNSDFDGDGREDLLDQKLPWVDLTETFEFRSFDIYRIGELGSSALFSTSYSALPDPTYRFTSRPGSYMLTGDLTGDGKTDVLGMFEEQFADVDGLRDHKLFLWAQGTWSELSYPSSSYLTFFRGVDILALWDVDGDGQMEVVGLNANDACSGYGQTCRVLRLVGNNSLEQLSVSDVPVSGCNTFEVYPGDFNGDGRTDLLTKRWDGLWWI
jgi:hypothetical protein